MSLVVPELECILDYFLFLAPNRKCLAQNLEDLGTIAFNQLANKDLEQHFSALAPQAGSAIESFGGFSFNLGRRNTHMDHRVVFLGTVFGTIDAQDPMWKMINGVFLNFDPATEDSDKLFAWHLPPRVSSMPWLIHYEGPFRSGPPRLRRLALEGWSKEYLENAQTIPRFEDFMGRGLEWVLSFS